MLTADRDHTSSEKRTPYRPKRKLQLLCGAAAMTGLLSALGFGAALALEANTLAIGLSACFVISSLTVIGLCLSFCRSSSATAPPKTR